jgi:hypothetical protein
MMDHFLREDHGAYVGPITPGAAFGATGDSSVIAKREAMRRSGPAGLDCHAPAGLAMTRVEGGSSAAAVAGAACADVSSDAFHSSVIARREAPWRSRPAGLDCRAPAGLAMTGEGRGEHPSALARLQAELDRAVERLADLEAQTDAFVGRVLGAERRTREDEAVDRPAPHAHRLAATGLLIHQALTRVERAVARLGEIG